MTCSYNIKSFLNLLSPLQSKLVEQWKNKKGVKWCSEPENKWCLTASRRQDKINCFHPEWQIGSHRNELEGECGHTHIVILLSTCVQAG